jgi:endonuclease IV
MSGEFILGVHVTQVSKVLDSGKKRELHDAIIEDTDVLGLNAAQVFLFGPRLPIENKVDYPKIVESSKDLDLTTHSPYSTVGIWKVNTHNKTETKSKTKLTQFKNQMLATKKAGGWCMVVHIAKNLPEDIADTMTLLKPIAKSTGVKIGLEMVASKADREKTYETPEKLDNLATLLGKNETYYCFVVDTAHIWGAGQDIQSYHNMKDWLDRMTFKKKIGMFHLNGSYALRGSGKDKHAIPFTEGDNIWSGVNPQTSGVRAIVEFAKEQGIPMICEINRGTQAEVVAGLETIKKLGGVE